MTLRSRAALLGLCFLVAAPVGARADDGDDGRQDNRRCHGDQCRGSFSPGPFDRSPVDVHDNCISLDCSGRPKKQPGPAPKAILFCPPMALPAVPHCDPAPARAESLLPPSPAKLVAAMNAMAKGIGEAAGALAGAIVGGVGGVFL